MYEMRDFAEPEESEVEPRSRTVSFPDHYLVPYIEMCKKSKRITCGCSIIFIGLAIYFFFATNYTINYPVTGARKIVFVFVGVSCLIAAASCLELRFRILQQCRGGPEDNVLFEMARRDVELSDSFSGHFEMQETSFCNGTPKEGPSQTETPEDSSSLAHTINDPCFADISTFRYSGHGRLPRHSISGGLSPDTPLLPQRRPLELSWPSWMKNGMDSKRLQNGGTVSDNNKYPPNYSTFENGCEASDTQPLLAKPTFENGCDAPETEPLLAESTFENGCDAPETEPLLAESTVQNGCDALETEPLPAKKS